MVTILVLRVKINEEKVMKSILNQFIVILLCCLSLSLISCTSGTNQASPTNFKISPTNASAKLGESVSITVYYDEPYSFYWTNFTAELKYSAIGFDESIQISPNNGLCSASHFPGISDKPSCTFQLMVPITSTANNPIINLIATATITYIASKGVSGAGFVVNSGKLNSTITVIPNTIPQLNITLLKNTINIAESTLATVKVESSVTVSTTVNLSSSNVDIAEITPLCIIPIGESMCEATITGITSGQSQITASANGYEPASTNITVIPNAIIPQLNVTLLKNTINITESTLATVTVESSVTVRTTVNLSSSNVDVAEVTPLCVISIGESMCYATIIGITSGQSQITASANRYERASTNITVNPAESATLSLVIQDPHVPEYGFTDATAFLSVISSIDQEILFSASSGSIIFVDGDSCNILPGDTSCAVTMRRLMDPQNVPVVITASTNGYQQATAIIFPLGF